ncbi:MULTISPECIES: hypothetical protein [unclassified Streptomyces]|uniref:hypothetical protein n=1 Tax=unclassified Streptomyces TaxID=2593676 RepID=UPI0019055D30|nr:hypothetical protein [Streptomyces sp. HSG2]
MPSREFSPGRLVAGIFLTLTGVVCLADAAGVWEVPWFAPGPLVAGGLLLAGVAALVGRAARRRRRPGPR